ncbi:hypothetical protein CF132_21735 [Aeromonas dhakensis]|nr:hypothetical protein CF132_21735 [Aeromonas dhakensis]
MALQYVPTSIIETRCNTDLYFLNIITIYYSRQRYDSFTDLHWRFFRRTEQLKGHYAPIAFCHNKMLTFFILPYNNWIKRSKSTSSNRLHQIHKVLSINIVTNQLFYKISDGSQLARCI